MAAENPTFSVIEWYDSPKNWAPYRGAIDVTGLSPKQQQKVREDCLHCPANPYTEVYNKNMGATCQRLQPGAIETTVIFSIPFQVLSENMYNEFHVGRRKSMFLEKASCTPIERTSQPHPPLSSSLP